MAVLSDFGAGDWDRTAAVQQLALLRCVWDGRRDLASELVAPEGEVIHWNEELNSWPPAWCLVRSGGPRYFLCCVGTTNVKQAAGHLWGSTGRTYAPGVLVNGQWLDVWRGMLTTILPLLPMDNPALRLFCSGFSYGGAVAQLASLDFAQRLGGDRVQLLNLAAPKVLTEGFAGPVPSVSWRVRSSNDIVPTLPPNGSLMFAAPFNIATPGDFTARVLGWQHYGEDDWVNAIGGANPDQPPPATLPQGVSVGPFDEHSTLNYLSRIRAGHDRGGGG